MKKSIVFIPESMDSRKKSWRKFLTGVNISKSNGYAFEGNWLRAGEKAELAEGSHVLTYDEPGSMKNWYPVIGLYRVEDGLLKNVFEYEGDIAEKSWALSVRDKIASLLSESYTLNRSPLDGFEDFILIEELKNRGYSVEKV